MTDTSIPSVYIKHRGKPRDANLRRHQPLGYELVLQKKP